MTTDEGNLALLVQVEESYGTFRIAARVVLHNAADELLGISWSYGGFDKGAEFDGFVVHAYLGSASGMTPLEGERGVWGIGHSYSPFRIEKAKQAKAIASILGRLERGLEKISSEDGYLDRNDFAGYLLRIGRLLRIKDFWVRNDAERRVSSGQHNRQVNGAGLQLWVQDVDQITRDSKVHTLVRR